LRRLAGASIITGSALAASGGAASAEGAYLRFGVGYDWSQTAIFTDRDCVSALILLYGCGPSNDGLPTGAYGTFGMSSAFEFAAGFRAMSSVRFEMALSLRHTFDFVGDANFDKVTDPQPVSATLSQASLMGWAYLDIARPSARLTPFIGIGIGLSRNALSEVRMDFPTLNQPAWTIAPPGTRISPAFGITAGIGHELSEDVTFEIAWRLVSYGRVATDVGPVLIRRGGTYIDHLVIDETWTTLVTNAVMFSLRWAIAP